MTLQKFTIDEAKVCVCVCLCVCLSLTSDGSETVEIIIVKLGKVTASDMRMFHMLTISTLTFIQGHTDLNHDKNKCFIISESFQAMPIKFAVKIVRLKVYILSSILIPMTFLFGQGHNCVSNLTHC